MALKKIELLAVAAIEQKTTVYFTANAVRMLSRRRAVSAARTLTSGSKTTLAYTQTDHIHANRTTRSR